MFKVKVINRFANLNSDIYGLEALHLEKLTVLIVCKHPCTNAVGNIIVRTNCSKNPFVTIFDLEESEDKQSYGLWGPHLENYIFKRVPLTSLNYDMRLSLDHILKEYSYLFSNP